jgi:hypothetical protein
VIRSHLLITAAFALLAIAAQPLTAQGRSVPCDSVAGFHTLDFWVGEWDVRSGEQTAGSSTIEKILNGCAVMEHWRGAGGGNGTSLFFFDHRTDTWKQVWVTEYATAPGGLKEKSLIARRPDGSVQFQGTVTLADGRAILDRTTLSPLPGGGVRQVIETSPDDGATWQTRFDATYHRR